MSKINISNVRAGDRFYLQSIDTVTDAVSFEHDHIVEFRIDSDAYVYGPNGTQIGKFSLFGHNNWSYKHHNGAQLFDLGSDLLRAERFVVVHLLASGEF